MSKAPNTPSLRRRLAVFALLVAALAAVTSAPALANLQATVPVSQTVKVVNVYEVDAQGNPVAGHDVKADGLSLSIGDKLGDGAILDNDGALAVVITFSGGNVVTLAASATRMLVFADREYVCRCDCGNSTETYPPTNQEGCEALEGQACEHPAGTPRALEDCDMRWVNNVAVALEVYTVENGVAVLR
ncbi:MAG: hypothetical protein AAGN66_16985 [Acidobacteriota bacterium]